jgi:hypothetical protein
MYRANPSAETLQTYGEQVEATAAFMADFVSYDKKTGHYHLKGVTAMQETMSKDFSYDHPFELAYWQYGLNIANLWRERQGKERNAQWDHIIAHLSPLPEQGGIYTSGLPSISTDTFAEKSRSDHPAVLGASGLLPTPPTHPNHPNHPYTLLYNIGKMKQTLDWVIQNWNWQTTWGWDYGMIAMAATRLGEPGTALKALLIDTQKNTYLKNGHNFQTADRLRCYLPGNGALLTAVAMMCAGWDGCKEPLNPGFPKDGQWDVRWEGIQRMQ